MIFGLEYNFGSMSAKQQGSIVTPEEGTVANLSQSRPAHRISFGVFFDF